MSCTRKFREMKTAHEEEALLKKSDPKSTRYVTKWSIYNLFALSVPHSPGAEAKAAPRLFKMNVCYQV